jgi:hypothetical protein
LTDSSQVYGDYIDRLIIIHTATIYLFRQILTGIPLLLLLLQLPAVYSFNNLGMVLDFFKPYYYRIEQKVASKGIPEVASKTDRITLDTCSKQGASLDHSLWTAVLKRHVVPDCTCGVVTGVNAVDYAALQDDTDYAAYMDILAKADPTSLSGAEQLAFWMNAYNAACINLIVEHEKKSGDKLTSINKLTDSSGQVWDQPAAIITGKPVSLSHIEHEQLRGVWAEPAVHACIVCASSSCPNLRPEAFEGVTVAEQMKDQMKQWMTNDTKGLRVTGNRLELSRIFLWFSADFGSSNADIRKFLQPYVAEHQNKIVKGSPVVRYFEYDWQMNRAPSKE